jgi:hypothetical protein
VKKLARADNDSTNPKWVVIAFWGVETTTTFHPNEAEALDAYNNAYLQGADATIAEVWKLHLNEGSKWGDS